MPAKKSWTLDADRPLAWESGDRSLSGLLDTWIRIIARPMASFAAPPQGGWQRPALFAVLINIAVTVILWALMKWMPGQEFIGGGLMVTKSTAALVERAIIIVPLLNLTVVLFQAVVLNLLMKVLAGVEGGFVVSLRAVCYAQAPHLIVFLGMPGRLAFFIWNLGLAVIGLAKGHRVSYFKSAAACVIYMVVSQYVLQMLL
jgi:hypothetical protein